MEIIIKQLKLLVEIYNVSKYKISSNDELDRIFHADDAIICYFTCRLVGKEILLKIDEIRESKTYEIDWNKYERDINKI